LYCLSFCPFSLGCCIVCPFVLVCELLNHEGYSE
jgi:hypothetical protein